MRPALLVLALAVWLAAAAPADAAPRWPRPQSYSADLRWNDAAKTLSGSERIAFRNDGPAKLSYVWLRVWPNGYGSCARPWAKVGVVRGGKPTKWDVGCTALHVRLSKPVAARAAGAITLSVHVTVPATANRFGQDGGVTYLGNALPLLAVQDSSGPALEPYTDLGDPFYSRSASWSVRLDVPDGLTAATTGAVNGRHRLNGGRKRLDITASHARDFAIVLGRFDVESVRTANGITLRRYRLAGSDRGPSLEALRVARAAVERYSYWFGSPGESEIDLLPGPSSLGSFGSGMEFPGLVLTPDAPLMVAHELAHQWWYALVGDDQWLAPWLDESFAEFSARRLPPEIVGADMLTCDDQDPVAALGPGPLDASMKQWDSLGGDAYYNTVYLGGTCALRSLQRDLGFDGMTAFLRGYADAHRFDIVTTADFVAALRAAAPAGYDVDAFLRRAELR